MAMDNHTRLQLLKWCLEQGNAFIESLECAHDAGEIELDYKDCLCLIFERGLESVKAEINSLTC